jgi:N-acyl-D-aspartate/D-glutamate deacylase
MDAFYELRPFKYYAPDIVPLDEFKRKAKELYNLNVDWKSFPEFMDRVEKTRLGPNLLIFAGHNTIRVAVMGEDEKRRPEKAELEEMKRLVADAMNVGAWGLSTGLDYPPGVYSDTEEIVELAKVAAEYGGIYSTHWRRTGLRREQTSPQEKIRGLIEAVEIGKRVGIPVQISHLLSGYTITPPPPSVLEEASAKATLELVDRSVRDGVDVWFDVIPNTTGGVFTTSSLVGLLSPWVREIGSPEGLARALKLNDFRSELKELLNAGKWYMLNPRTDPHWATRIKITDSKVSSTVGKTIAELAEERDRDPLDVLFDLLQEDPDARALPATIQGELEKAAYLKHPRAMVGIDTFSFDYRWETKHTPKIYPHPNTYGVFARYFRVYQRELGVLSLEEAVRKVTGISAQRFGLIDRGVLNNGMKADIVVFDLKEIGETGDHMEPRKHPKGIRHVFVNGTIVVENGVHTGKTPGSLIRKNEGRR